MAQAAPRRSMEVVIPKSLTDAGKDTKAQVTSASIAVTFSLDCSSHGTTEIVPFARAWLTQAVEGNFRGAIKSHGNDG